MNLLIKKNEDMRKYIFFILVVLSSLNIFSNDVTNQPFYNTSPKDGLWEAMDYYGIHHQDIVYAQAYVETGNFTSIGCKNKNNLFGLMQGKKLRRFNHWSESVKFYKEKIQSKYKGGDYYSFLKRIKYATSPTYNQALKKVVKKIKRK